MRVLVTGAAGFLGRFTCRHLRDAGWSVRGAIRRNTVLPWCDEVAFVGEVDSGADWTRALDEVQAVVHLAARVHVMRDMARNPLAEFRRVNVDGTRQLAGAASRAGVKRMVFVSSIKVNGEETGNHPFTESDPTAPQDAYARSKLEAEEELWAAARESGLQGVVVRPPLVYGPGVEGNLKQLMKAVANGWPLPLGAIRNRRSFIGVQNLADLLVRCVEHPAAAGQTFLAADGKDLSTPRLITLLSRHRKPWLFSVPPGILRMLASAVGKREQLSRLCSSLQVDASKARGMLGWTPPMTVEDGLRAMVSAYHGDNS